MGAGVPRLPTVSLRDAATPFLEDVRAVLGHHVQLGVLDADDVLFVERLSARDAVINFSQIAGPLRPVTPRGFDSPAALRSSALAEARRRQSAVLDGHQHPDATGVAVPVRDSRGEVVAALSVVVPNDGRGAGRAAAAHGGARHHPGPPDRRPGGPAH
ncbi:IclR family transcriptional regulator domain-containing protein [Modestobacter sp. SYSU DS0290]